ncbi:MAG: thiosulfate oxidation carrier protein SoxY [Gammaproteobacteria bacterium]|jgi:sulfur-oxidizing protein SoxY|nr:thiosulfate oxidation carrier protein SoxY [Gammaproteobacteria bacterium]
MNQNRRVLLKGTFAAGVTGIAISAGLLTPKAVLAAWPKAAFEAKDTNAALEASLGSSSTIKSSDIKLKAPDIAENGAVVPITVTSNIANTESISIVIVENGTPLAATFNLGANTKGFVSTRVKMGKTSDVIAVIKAGGKLYSTSKNVKVTIGGCGG